MIAFYNEIDDFACGWLSNLMDAGLITPGYISNESIEDIIPSELVGYDRVHFFAGIGGWDYALNLAGWGDRPVWTGSCPCQSFSAAGQRKGFADERHLWPAFFHLIEQCRPDWVFGEQVASSDALAWLDLVCTDLEGTGYAARALDMCAAGFGAPHIRQRLYWVADTASTAKQGLRSLCFSMEPFGPSNKPGSSDFWKTDAIIRCADGKTRPIKSSVQPLAHGVSNRMGLLRGYGNAIVPQEAAEFIKAVMYEI